jgi:hypothetical protein
MNVKKIIETKLKEQEVAVIDKLTIDEPFSVKRYPITEVKTNTGIKVSRPLIFFPRRDRNVIESLSFEEASENYQSVVLNLNVNIEK